MTFTDVVHTFRLNPHRIAYIGVRMLDPPERAIIDRLGIPCYSTREIDELGIREVWKYKRAELFTFCLHLVIQYIYGKYFGVCKRSTSRLVHLSTVILFRLFVRHWSE